MIRTTDAQGRETFYEWFDTDGGKPNWDKRLQRITMPDHKRYEFERADNGDITAFSVYDALTGLKIEGPITCSNDTFPDSQFVQQFTQQNQDPAGNILSKSTKTWQKYDNIAVGNVTNSVYVLESEKTWMATNPAAYSETHYLYNTNTFLLDRVEMLVSGTNEYRTVSTYTYNANRRVESITDALTNTTWLAYDPVGRVSSVTRTNSSSVAITTTNSYDNLDRPVGVGYPDATTESWSHAPCGCGVLSHIDRGGNITTNSYNSDKWLSKVRTWSPNGTLLSQVEYLYNAAGVATNTWDALTNRTISVYNTAGDLVYSIDPLIRTNQYLYDSYGRQYKTIFPDGTASSNSYDSASRVIKTSRLASSTSLSSVQFSYDYLGRQVTTTDPVGTVTSNAYDMAGRVHRTYNLTLGTYTESVYDLLGNVILRIGPVATNASSSEIAAATVTNSYDILNRLVMTVDSEDRTNSYLYDPDWPNQVKYVVDSAGTTNQFNYYDTFTGRLLTNMTEGVQTVYIYDSLGQVTNTLFADGSSAINIYDGNRLLHTIGRTGVTNSFGYDPAGRQSAFTNGLGAVTAYKFDAAGNTTNTTDALSQNTKYNYDSMNRLTLTTLPDSRASTNAYTSLGQLSSRTGAGSIRVSYNHDAAGRMTKLIDGEANKTDFAYDGGNRLTQKTYADNSFYQYGYNPRGWLTLRTDPKGCQTAYSYNNVRQLTNVNYASDVDISYFYDNLGRMTSRTDAAGTWVWSYDGDSSRLLSESVSGGAITSTVSYTYHPYTFDLASVGLDSSNRTFYTWEKGRLTQVSNFQFQVFYSYGPNSDLLSEMTNSVFFTRRSYDALSRLVAVSNNVGTTSVSRFLYTLDSTGRRTKRTDVDNSWIDWGYDSYDQLVSAARTNSPNGAADAAYKFAYQYDQVGNRLHEDRGQLDLDGTFNPLNQLTYLKFGGKLDVYGSVDNTGSVVVVGGVTSAPPFYGTTNWLGASTVGAGSNSIPVVVNLGTNSSQTNLVVYFPPTNPQVLLWDRNGNLTNDSLRLYFWDEENRLNAIETVAGLQGVERRRSEYLYDAQSRRIQKKDLCGWNGSAYATTNVTRFVWDGFSILAVLNEDNSVRSYVVHGLDLSQSLQGAGGIGGILAMVHQGTNFFYTTDGNGNITDVLDDQGSVVAHYEYSPFGRLTASAGTFAEENPWRFSSQWYESFWKHYRYVYRVYLPDIGWLTKHPATFASPLVDFGLFAANSPVQNVDVLGGWPFSSKTEKDKCEEALKAINSEYATQIKSLRANPKCKLGKIICSPPNQLQSDLLKKGIYFKVGGVGGYNPDTGDIEILVLEKDIQGYDPKVWNQTVESYKQHFVHEIQHAFESCTPADPAMGECRRLLCEEVRASYCANYDWLDARLKSDNLAWRKENEDWLKSAAWSSAQKICCQRPKEGANTEPKAFKKIDEWCPLSTLNKGVCWWAQ